MKLTNWFVQLTKLVQVSNSRACHFFIKLTLQLLFISLIFLITVQHNSNLVSVSGALTPALQSINTRPMYFISQAEYNSFLVFKLLALASLLCALFCNLVARQKHIAHALLLLVTGVFWGWLWLQPLGGVNNQTILLALITVIALYVTLKKSLSRQSHKPKAKYLLTYASQSGQAKAIASAFYQANREMVDLKCASDVSARSLSHYNAWLVVASTYGEGVAPDNARKLLHTLKHVANAVNKPFSILGLGDNRYQQFCGFAVAIRNTLIASGANELVPLEKVHQANPQQITAWWQKICGALGLSEATQSTEYTTATLVNNRCLNPSKAHRAVHHLIFHVPNARYCAGDLLEILPRQSEQQINRLIAHFGFEANDYVRLHTKQMPLAEALAQCEWPSLKLHYNNAQDLIDDLKPIHPRAYSIASKSNDPNVALLVRKKHFATTAQPQLNTNIGLCSGYLCELQQSTQVAVRIRQHPQFHLPTTPAPMVMIAGGTGLAPYMGMLQELSTQKVKHQNWLFFAEQNKSIDNYLSSELHKLQQSNVLTRLVNAWSQDGNQCYIDSVLSNHVTSLKALANQGAYFYVCGSLHGFGKTAVSGLKQILGEHEYEQLQQRGRIKLDLY